MKNVIEILIVDDHPIVRQGLRQTIESSPDLKVVAEAGDGEEALAKIRQFEPQIVVLDIDIPRIDGFQVAVTVQAEKIKTKIIFLTIHREESFMKKALSVGAKGFVLKDSAVSDIISAIKVVHQGQSFISPAMATYLMKSQTQTKNFREGLSSLTPAERNVLKLIAQYKTTKDIAEILFVSTRTIESHRFNICQKLHLQGSHSLMKFALANLSEIQND